MASSPPVYSGADESNNVRIEELSSTAVLRLNQRAGTVRTPDYGRRLFVMWFDGKPTIIQVRELIDFLECGERDTKAHRDNQTKLKRLMENIDMATTTKKTAGKKGSVFGAEEPKGAVDRPKATVDKNKKPFVPTTPKELKDIEKTAAKKAEAKADKKAVVKKADAAHKAAMKKSDAAHKAAVKKSDAKPAAEPKTSNVGRKSKIDGTQKITVLVDENPKRAGSNAHARFAKYKTGMTVSKALELGVTPADLAYDTKSKYISIA